jgi:hypothetical protein
MDDLLARFRSNMDQWGIHVTPIGSPGNRWAGVRLVRGPSVQDYRLLYGETITSADAARVAGADLPILVFTTYAAPRTIDTFRRAGVHYLDAAGNAWITFGDVFIDVRGRSRPDQIAAPKRVKGNLFSSGRAQVVCALLAWPDLWHAGRREVAHAAGVSVGQAHNALVLLAEAGYDGGEIPPRQTLLLDLWASAFPTGLAANLILATFRGDIDQPRLARPDDVGFVSGEAAVPDLLRPATLTLYVGELDPRLPVVNRWRSDGEPNVVVRRAFWHAPAGNPLPIGLAIAPWPIVYADLLSSADPRVRGAAREWRDRSAEHVR